MSSTTSSPGVTQSIRSRLNFNDESRWKRFSARRLELIDQLSLSNRKASEQDEKIESVATTLREEYEYPPDFQQDFDRLVRAGIQSVRRNRKRLPKSKQKQIDDNIIHHHCHHHNVNSKDIEKKLKISSLVSPSPPPHRDPNSSIAGNFASLSLVGQQQTSTSSGSGNESSSRSSSRSGRGGGSSASSSNGSSDLFISSLNQLSTLLHRLSNHKPDDLHQTNSNIEFLGDSIINSAASFSLEKKNSDSVAIPYVRSTVLSSIVLNALADCIGVASVTDLKALLANCSMKFGFDQTINSLSSVFYELLELDQRSELISPSELADAFPASLKSSPLKLYQIRSVKLRFLDQKLDFTFDPSSNNTPPTISEIIENGKIAFHIIGDKNVIKIRDLDNMSLLDTDRDVADLFSQSLAISLELFMPFINSDIDDTNTNNKLTNNTNHKDNDNNLLEKNQNGTRLPPISKIKDEVDSVGLRPKFQPLS